MAKMEAAKVKATTDSPAKAGILKRPRSSIGSVRSKLVDEEQTMSRPSQRGDATIVALPQPRSLPRTSAKTSRNKLAENVTKPTQSTRRVRGSFDSADLGEA